MARRAICALAVAARLPSPPAWAVEAGIFSAVTTPAKYVETRSGILYFDEKLGTGYPYPADRVRLWTPGTELTPVGQADGVKEVNGPGKKVIIDYRVRREGKFTGSFDGEIVALSDGISNGGSVFFVIGDGTVNPAVEEMVRTLPPKVVRRAIVPAKFDLDKGTRKTYPREEPPGITYLELNLRSPFASNSVGVCEGSESVDSAFVASCICSDGRAEGYSVFDGLGESEGMGYAAPGNRR